MTGLQIHTIRNRLGLGSFAFAGLLGVHVSTVYRWEATRVEVAVDPIQRELLVAISTKLKARRKAATAIQQATKTGLINGGTLHALLNVLKIVLT